MKLSKKYKIWDKKCHKSDFVIKLIQMKGIKLVQK